MNVFRKAQEAREATFTSETGAKRNSLGKIPYGDLPLDLLAGAAWVMNYGARKYGHSNYRKGFEPRDAMHSVLRHISSLQAAIEQDDKTGDKGLLLDDETKQAHIHHAITSLLILVQSMHLKGYAVHHAGQETERKEGKGE